MRSMTVEYWSMDAMSNSHKRTRLSSEGWIASEINVHEAWIWSHHIIPSPASPSPWEGKTHWSGKGILSRDEPPVYWNLICNTTNSRRWSSLPKMLLNTPEVVTLTGKVDKLFTIFDKPDRIPFVHMPFVHGCQIRLEGGLGGRRKTFHM